MPKAYIIHRRWVSYRRYITRSAGNGYHCKKPLLSGRQKRFFTWWRRRGSNPRPYGCEPYALPAELRPHLYVTALFQRGNVFTIFNFLRVKYYRFGNPLIFRQNIGRNRLRHICHNLRNNIRHHNNHHNTLRRFR